jgi:hypothetical protein
LHEQVENLALIVNRALQRELSARYHHGHLVEMLSSAHLAISLAVSLALLTELLFVHTSGSEFSAVDSLMVAVVIALVVAITRVYLDASRPNLHIL